VEFDFKEKLCIRCSFYSPNKNAPAWVHLFTGSENHVTPCPTTAAAAAATAKYMSISQNLETKPKAQKIAMYISWQNQG
jgi:hypothetical protein